MSDKETLVIDEEVLKAFGVESREAFEDMTTLYPDQIIQKHKEYVASIRSELEAKYGKNENVAEAEVKVKAESETNYENRIRSLESELRALKRQTKLDSITSKVQSEDVGAGAVESGVRADAVSIKSEGFIDKLKRLGKG